jgi:DNA-binding transcriptional ArsR family regulator
MDQATIETEGEMAAAGKRRNEDEGRRRADLISAIDHPARRRILRLLLDRDERLSAVEIAGELSMTLGDASYHVRVLQRFRAARPAGKRQVRGALQSFFRAAIEEDPPIEMLLEETKEFDESLSWKREGRSRRGRRRK